MVSSSWIPLGSGLSRSRNWKDMKGTKSRKNFMRGEIAFLGWTPLGDWLSRSLGGRTRRTEGQGRTADQRQRPCRHLGAESLEPRPQRMLLPLPRVRGFRAFPDFRVPAVAVDLPCSAVEYDEGLPFTEPFMPFVSSCPSSSGSWKAQSPTGSRTTARNHPGSQTYGRIEHGRSSWNPGSTVGRSDAFPTAYPVAYIHCVIRRSFGMSIRSGSSFGV